MDLLTPALRQSLNVASEAELDDQQFAIVSHFASLPCPPPDKPTHDEFDKIIVAMAVVLKKPNASLDHGRLKIGVYRKVLGNLSLTALSAAATAALETLQWMPTPAELLTLAKGHSGEAQRLHSKACVMRRNRAQRIHDETLRQVAAKTISHDDLQHLGEFTARCAITQGLIITMRDGSRHYRTAETIQQADEERKRAFEAEGMSGSRAGGAETGGAENG